MSTLSRDLDVVAYSAGSFLGHDLGKMFGGGEGIDKSN